MQITYIYQINLISSILFLGIWNWWHVWCQEKNWKVVQFNQWGYRYEILVRRYDTTVPHLRRWFSFCSKNGLQSLNADLTSDAEFLTHCFRKSSCEYSSVNTARSALSSISPAVVGFTFGEQPLIKRLFRGRFKQRITFPRYSATYGGNMFYVMSKNVLFSVKCR